MNVKKKKKKKKTTVVMMTIAFLTLFESQSDMLISVLSGLYTYILKKKNACKKILYSETCEMRTSCEIWTQHLVLIFFFYGS
jgi:hypothetical protein